ncbi:MULTISPECIES: shikimate kinase [unclassified Bacillus (in: firmicutes)]|uniref:AAA family ATPase n=1 Tax=unclassified Bacillus (in: firmicutes) TaxID=185979 RepID=UPI0008E2DCA3|nr:MULTISPECIES: shikimate kinase [unclassified Bacillus (in: firmicutes)]SFA86608.1 Adenylate kinase [Bacillus sp. UNCCL13]SFQ83769.1 Adenylate kinase [Bacillus sp. cl95]
MKKNVPNKIHIIGSVGSGKTTLARKLSTELNIPFFELDNVMWIRNKSGDIRRTEEERKEYLNSILHSNAWIIEGVHNDEWVLDCFHHAELIVFLDKDYSIRIYRIIKRFILQRLRIEKSNYRPTFQIFIKMFKWNRLFEEVEKPSFYKKSRIYSDKILLVKNSDDIRNHLMRYSLMTCFPLFVFFLNLGQGVIF